MGRKRSWQVWVESGHSMTGRRDRDMTPYKGETSVVRVEVPTTPATDAPSWPPLHVSCASELVAHEKELIRRIGKTPNGGMLLLLDPQRLLAQVGLQITAGAVEECRSSFADLFKETGRERAYDATAAAKPQNDARVSVRGLFRKGRT